MGTFFIYIIKSAICLIIFYLFFKLLLSKDTFHRFNRMALLSLMLLSFVIPVASYLFHPTKLSGVVNLDSMLQAGNAVVLLNTPIKTGTNYSLLWIQVLMLVYLMGVFVFFTRQILSLVNMFKLIQHSQQLPNTEYTLYLHDKKIAPFSWMKRIVLSTNDLHENQDKIIKHELAHIRMGHSWDLLLVDMCLSFQWFNPASWLLKQEIQSIHEFEADDVVLRQGIDAKQYQLLLIEKAVGTRLYSMANSFNHSSLKKRITMMLQKKSNPWARLKYLYVLPLTCVTVLAFAHPEVSTIERQSTQKIDESVALATTEIGNLSANKIKEFSGMNNPSGIKNKDILLAQVNNTQQEVGSITTVAPSIIVRGKVVSTDKQTLSGISVAGLNVEGRILVGTVTNDDGSYVLKVPNTTNRLQFFKSGYKTLMVPMNDNLIVTMEVDTSATNKSTTDRVIKIVDFSNLKVSNVDDNTNKVTTINISDKPDKMPQYPGGDEALMKYLRESVRYPAFAQKNKIEGRVVCTFVVTTEGDVVNVTVAKGVSPELDSEAMRVILNMPDWTPGKKDGVNVTVNYTIPIVFKLNKDNVPPPPPKL